MTKEEFIHKFANPVINATLGTNLFPSVKLAQAALESAWGSRFVGNNLFGIKAKGSTNKYWDGRGISAQTAEVFDGISTVITDAFRLYNTLEDSIKDHTLFLRENPRYAAAGVFTAPTPEAQAKALQRAGYATDPDYAAKLIAIIQANNFERFDQKKK